MSSHLKVLMTISWLTLFLCAAVFLFIAACAPNTVLVTNASARDESVRSIETSTDLRFVQQQATGLVHNGLFTSELSRMLCLLAISTLLLVMVGASISLVLIRRLRRQLSESTHTAS
jgi:hypothetical protein